MSIAKREVLLALNLKQMQGADSVLIQERGVLTGDVAAAAHRSVRSTAAHLSQMRDWDWVQSTPGDGDQLGWVLLERGVSRLEQWRRQDEENAKRKSAPKAPFFLPLAEDAKLMEGMILYDPDYHGRPQMWSVAKVNKRSTSLVWSDAQISMTATLRVATLPKGWAVLNPEDLARSIATRLGALSA